MQVRLSRPRAELLCHVLAWASVTMPVLWSPIHRKEVIDELTAGTACFASFRPIIYSSTRRLADIATNMDRRTLLKIVSGVAIGLPTHAAATRDRVVIVGAGIMGASIGYHLAKRGAHVTILEKKRPGNGATEKSFAWINSSFSKQPHSYFDLNLRGIAGWRRLTLELGGDLHIQWGGSVEWFEPGTPEAEKLMQQVRAHQQWGYPTHLVDEGEIRRLLPAITPGAVGTSCYSEIEGTLDPMHALTVLLKHAQLLGARVLYPCEVKGISVASDRVRGVETTNGPVPADFLVLASGVDTPRLARLVDINVPLKESPGLLAHTTPQPRMLERIALAPGANIKQNPDGRIVTGTSPKLLLWIRVGSSACNYFEKPRSFSRR